jgi:hypothetical protein
MPLKRSNSSRNLAATSPKKSSSPKSPKLTKATGKPPLYPKTGKTGKLIHGIAHKSGGKKNKTQRRR